MASGCLAKVVFSDAKHNFLIHYILALGVLLITPILFGLNDLDEKLAAQPLEIMLPLVGVILMTPVFMPEQNESIRDVVRARKTSYHLVCFLRLLLAAVIMTVMTGAIVLYMKHCGSEVTFRHFSGAAASAAALGSLGFFAAAFSDNAIAGYMASLIYYIANFFLKQKLGVFFLFSMTFGSFSEKKWLIILSLVLIAAAFSVRKFRE